MEANVSKYTNAVDSGKQAITQGQKRKGGRGMREGWEYKKLGEVASSELGKTLNKSKDTGKLYPYICAVNVLWDMIDLTILKHAFFEKEEIDRYSVRKGDLLVCEGGDTGRSAIWEQEEPVLYQNALHRVRFTTEMEARFAMYCLWHLKNNGQIDQKYSKGVTIKHLVKSSLLSIELPVPPLSTQLSIVSELDKINELIRLKKEQLKDYDNLAQSIFYEMFGDPIENEKGWEVKKLGDVCEVSSFKRVLVEDVLEKGPVPFIRGTELSAICKENKREYKMYITMEHYERVKNISGVPNVGDLLIPSINAEGLVWVVDTPEPMYYKDGRVLWVHVDQNSISSIALQRILNNLIKDNYSKITNGAVFAELNLSILRSFPIILPPLSIQNAFANKINLIEKQKAEIQSTIADLETLLASRMQYWFD